jgi:subtilisin family serine protease
MKRLLFILISTSSFFLEAQDIHRVFHVKFDNEIRVELVSGQLFVENQSLKPGTLDQFGYWEPFYSIAPEQLNVYYQKAKQKLKKNLSNPNTLFEFHLHKGIDLETARKELENLPHIRYVSIPPKLSTPAAPDFESLQLHLFEGDHGIHAAEFTATYNMRGAGVKVCDIEYQFNEEHTDLPPITIIGPPPGDAGFGNYHATAVLGEIASLNDGIGTTGIACESQMYFAGIYTDSTVRLEEALISTLSELGEGDIVLIELQIPDFTNPNETIYVPVEWYEPYYDAIQLISGNGIIVAEASGNGNQDLDAPFFSMGNNGHYPFLQENWSEAIMVGAGSVGTVDIPLSRMWFSNYGSRLDVQGNGEEVVTTSYGDLYSDEGENQYYTKVFNGTSSALPIVVGAVSLLQSLYKSHTGEPFDVDYIRNLLVSTGKPQIDGILYPVSQKIGPLPNVFAAANEMMEQLNLGVSTYDKNAFSIYPNPTNGSFSILVPGNDVEQLRLTDLSGKEVQFSVTKTIMGFESENKDLLAGMYYLSIIYKDGTISTKPVRVINE